VALLAHKTEVGEVGVERSSLLEFWQGVTDGTHCIPKCVCVCVCVCVWFNLCALNALMHHYRFAASPSPRGSNHDDSERGELLIPEL